MILRYYSTYQYQSFILVFIEMSLMAYHLREFYFLRDQIEEYQQNILDFIGNRTAMDDGSYVNISFSA